MNTTEKIQQYSSKTLNSLEKQGELFINGEWVTPNSGKYIEAIDPSTEKIVSMLAAGNEVDIDRAVNAAKSVAENESWSRMAPERRERLILRLAELLEENSDHLAELETMDVGMPFGMAKYLVGTSVSSLRYMAGWPSKIEGRTIPMASQAEDSSYFACTIKEPVGVIGAIIPWNVPLMMAIWKIAPAIATGCTIVLKPAEDASLSILAFAKLFQEAGFPPGVLNIVTGTGPQAGAALALHPLVNRISFTGSTFTGRTIAKMAAETTKKVTLELGGKSPQILFADADLDKAIPTIAHAAFLNSGQTCVAGSRLYIESKVYDQALDKLSKFAESLRVGNPMEASTQLGPVINKSQRDKIAAFIEGATSQGAKIATKASGAHSGCGYYVSPTVLETSQNMTIAREEVFGPTISAIPFDDAAEAVALANDNQYGLASYVWTNDINNALYVGARLKTGKVAVNDAPAPYPSIAEGGRKASGYGRDQGAESVESCLETKVIVIKGNQPG